ncbi:MAG: hypothetical protein P4L27_01785 [Ignavibacteriaceae bacterium]|nr:hypothetical protein [Ignavibacteriaceae bacterium]
MRYNYLHYIIVVLIYTGLFTQNSYSQKPDYKCILKNDTLTSENTYEFDIYLQRTGPVQFELGGIQFGILYNADILNGGNLTASYVPGSVDASIIASGQQNKLFNTATPGVIKISANLATKGHGSGAIISSKSPGTKVGRLRIINSVPFAPYKANISLNFKLHPYPSKISAYIGSINTEITDSTKYTITLRNSVLSRKR